MAFSRARRGQEPENLERLQRIEVDSAKGQEAREEAPDANEFLADKVQHKYVKPIHPILVHFPIALLALSVAADLAGFFSNIDSLRSTGWWSLAGAALGGVATVLAGVFDMRRADLSEEIHERVHRHMKVGFALLAVITGLTLWRWTIFIQPGLAVTAIYLDCAILAMALAGFQGWLGGELVYTYGVSVNRAGPTTREKAKTANQDDPAKPSASSSASGKHADSVRGSDS